MLLELTQTAKRARMKDGVFQPSSPEKAAESAGERPGRGTKAGRGLHVLKRRKR